MKNHFIVILILVATLVSCSDNPNAVLGPDSALTLLHFTEPSYADYVLVSDYKNLSTFFLMRGNTCNAEYIKNTYYQDWVYDFESSNIHNPYIELADGWYLVDWRFPMYPLDAQTLLTDISWDNYHGEFSFDKSMPHISNKIYERKDIKIKDLVLYSYPDGNYPNFRFTKIDSQSGEELVLDVNEYIYYSLLLGSNDKYGGFTSQPYLNIDGDCLCNRVDELDELWDVFRKQLNTVIKNGDINSIPSASKEQMLQLLGEYY